MDKIIVFFVVVFFSMKVSAQLTKETIQADFVGKRWKITAYETFGVSELPNERQGEDYILLTPEGVFTIKENGSEYTGKFTLMTPVGYFSCKTDPKKWSKTYKIISIDKNRAVIQYKDDTLIKTDYYLDIE